MEPLPKRPKLNTKDPAVQFTRKILELIFQHLTFNEALLVSLLSHKWNFRVGSSKTCMSKIQICVNLERIGRLALSKRKYQCVKLIGGINFLDKTEFEIMTNFLQYNASFVISLWLVDCQFEVNSSYDDVTVFFTNIRQLKLQHVSSELSRFVFKATGSKVEHLELQNVTLDESFVDFLSRSEALQTVNVDLTNLNVISESSDLFSFKLKKLVVTNFWRYVAVKPLLQQYLLTHTSSIESLSLSEVKVNVSLVAVILNDMKALKTLHLGQILADNSETKLLKIFDNVSIIDMKLMTVPHSISKIILKHCLNIKTLHINRFSKTLVDIFETRKIKNIF